MSLNPSDSKHIFIAFIIASVIAIRPGTSTNSLVLHDPGERGRLGLARNLREPSRNLPEPA